MVLLETGASGTSREIPSNSLLSFIAQWLEHSVYNQGVASSNPVIGILAVNFSTGTRGFCVQ